MRAQAVRIAVVCLCAAGVRGTVVRAQTPDYDTALAASVSLEAAGRFDDAVRLLQPVHRAYPDDYALALRLGWLTYCAHDWSAAEANYSRALALSGGSSIEARRGLEWTARRAGESRPLRAWASVWLGAQFYGNHPVLRSSVSVAPSLTLQIADTVVVGVTYRALRYSLANSSTGLQQEVYGAFGLARPAWALRVHIGSVWDSGNPLVPAGVVGLSGRVRLHGELTAEVSRAGYTDGGVYRVGAGWALSLAEGITLGPTASVQGSGTGLGGSLGVEAAVLRVGYGLALSARVGDERRPTYLNESLTYATNDHIRAALSVTGRVPLGGGLTLAAGGAWQRLAVESTSTGPLSGPAPGTLPGPMPTLAPAGGSVAADAWFLHAALEGSW